MNISLFARIKPISYDYDDLRAFMLHVEKCVLIASTRNYLISCPVGKEVSLATIFKDNVCKCYVNGSLAAESPLPHIWDQIYTRVNFGYSTFHNGNGSFYLRDARIYNRALTQEEVQSISA